MKRYFLIGTMIIAVFLSACARKGPAPETTAAPSATPDPCAPENLAASVKKVHDIQREFDDASALSESLPREQLPEMITDMQRMRRAAEDLETPPCLANLKTHQLNYMNLVINTLIAFVGGADQAVLRDGVLQARAEYDLYKAERAALLGITLVPVTPVATP